MGYKKIVLITLFLLSVLTIGAVSASDNLTDDITTAEDSQQEEIEQADDIESSQDTLAADDGDEVLADNESTTPLYDVEGEKYEDEEDYDYGGVSIFAPSVQVKYKANHYFQVFLHDAFGVDSLSYHKVTLKIWSGKTAKKYTLKTNLYGVARISTKDLKLGTHKVELVSKEGSDVAKEVSKIVVKKRIPLHTKTIKFKELRVVSKSLKFKDTLRSYTQKGSDKAAYIEIKNRGDGVHFKIKKLKFFFKHKKTGKIKVVKVYKSKCNELSCLAQTKLLKKYTPYKAKVWYFKYRTHKSF